MNHAVTSRAELLSAARDIARESGLSQVNIRAVAARCGVAVGSLYNYFPTKADLIAAVLEDFWRTAIHVDACIPAPGEAFPAYVGRLYADLARSLAAFQSGWLSQLTAQGGEERQKGRALEAKCFDHMKRGIRAALDQSGAGGPVLATEEDRAAFVELVFSLLLSLLRQGQPDCAYLQRVLKALLS